MKTFKNRANMRNRSLQGSENGEKVEDRLQKSGKKYEYKRELLKQAIEN